MKKFTSSRILSLLLTVLLVVGLVPTAALAAEIPETECPEEHIVEEYEVPVTVEPEAECFEGNLNEEDAVVTEPTQDVEEPATEITPVPEQEASDSGLLWELDDGYLYIYGTGSIPAFASEEDQPWKDRRTEIHVAVFDESADLNIESIAYWFSGCMNLASAELPGYVREIGYHAFYHCYALHDVVLWCGAAPRLVPGAFITEHPLVWEVDHDPRLQFYVQNTDVMYALCDYDWTSDGTPVHISVQAPVMMFAALTADTPMLAASASGYCSNCGNTCAYTIGYSQWSDDVHCIRHWCSNCGLDQCGGVLAGSHAFSHYNSSYDRCSYCGYLTDCTHAASCSHPSYNTVWVTSCEYERYCSSCGAYLSGGTQHGPYTYGDWYYYSTSYHRRSYTCSYGDSGTYYESSAHTTSSTYQKYSSTQHKVVNHCTLCDSDIGSASYASHRFTYGSWASYNSTQHRRLKTCSDCGYSEYEYANHSLSYGSWASANATQHKRTVSCSCGYSATEYADHSLTVTQQSISDAQHKVTKSCSTCGYASSANETHSFTYGEWQSCSDTQHRRTKSCACGYSGYDYGDHNDANEDGNCDDCGHLLSRFSVTVPANLYIVVSADGSVNTPTSAAIVNKSTAAVKVTSVTVNAGNGWTLVPYGTNMADAKVDAKMIGFSINGASTSRPCGSESLTLGNGWSITKGASLPLSYDAVVSAMSAPVNEQVLTLVFVLDWNS